MNISIRYQPNLHKRLNKSDIKEIYKMKVNMKFFFVNSIWSRDKISFLNSYYSLSSETT